MAEETETESQVTTEKEKEDTRTLTQEDINKLIEGARKQEKDKLYETITTLRDQVTSLTDRTKKEEEEREKIKKEAEAKVEAERIVKLSTEDRVAEQLKKLEERLAKSDERATKLESDLETERDQAELERFKSELLRTEEDIIPELVGGKTKEEITASVKSAKEKYQFYFEAAVKKAEGTPGRQIKVPGPADPDPDALDEEDLKGLGALVRPEMTTGSMKSREEIIRNKKRAASPEYMKQREELLSKVGDLYRKSVRG